VTGRFNIYPGTSVCRILLALDPAVVLWSGNNWYLCRAVEGISSGKCRGKRTLLDDRADVGCPVRNRAGNMAFSTVCDRSTLCTLSSGAEKQGERNCGKHTPSMTFGSKRLALVGDTYLSGRLGWSRWNFGGRLCPRLLHFGNRAVPTGGRSICLGGNTGWSLFIYGNHRETGSVWRWHPFCLKHRGTPLVDLFRGASFVGEISPLEDLASRLGKQGLTHFSAHWIRCKGRPAYITVNEPLTLTLSFVASSPEAGTSKSCTGVCWVPSSPGLCSAPSVLPFTAAPRVRMRTTRRDV
jgi:hypothetical protein